MSDALPLEGTRVLSLAQQLPGPYCTMLLRDLGAEVVLIEQIPYGDPSRRGGVFFAALNRGKRSIGVDLKQDVAREAVHRLVATADVVIEGFRPGVAARLGVDVTTLTQLKPDLIYCSISGYGQTGTESLKPGHDLSYQARAAAIGRNGEVNPGLPLADVASAMYATMRILAAMISRLNGDRSPRYLDVSMTEAALATNVFAAAAVLAGTGDAPRTSPTSEPAYGLFDTSDGRVVLSIAFEQHFWSALCNALGHPEHSTLNVTDRRTQSSALRQWLQDELRQNTTAHWLATLGTADVPIERVNAVADLASDPLFRDRGMVVDHDGATWVIPPLGSRGSLDAINEGTPRVGQHTDSYLRPLLGDAEYEAGIADGALLSVESETAGSAA